MSGPSAANFDDDTPTAGLGMGVPIIDIARQHPKLIHRLRKFSFSDIAAITGGLLAQIENHPSTILLEALAHLGAAHAKGTMIATSSQTRDFINGELGSGSLGSLRDPVEDVFITNVVSWNGNIRVFEGIWQANGFRLQTALRALVLHPDQALANQLRPSIDAILALSEETARRTNVARNALSDQSARETVRISSHILDQARCLVEFDEASLATLNIDVQSLEPFIWRAEEDDVSGEEIGHSTLERRPLVKNGNKIILALPTAISAAVRRFIMEMMEKASALVDYDEAVKRVDKSNVAPIAHSGWRIKPVGKWKFNPELQLHEFTGTFDIGAYAHVVVLHSPVRHLLKNGLLSRVTISDDMRAHMDAEASRCAALPDYRRGLTLIIQGGLGGSCYASFEEPPPKWQRASICVKDFTLLGWDSEFECIQAWKLLEREDDMKRAGVSMLNIDGFVNLYAAGLATDFTIWPNEMAMGFITFASDYQAPMRHRLQTALDTHAELTPNRRQWIEVQRMTTSPFFKEARDLPIYVSAGHIGLGELLACVPSASRTWWMRCDHAPPTEVERNITFRIWDMALNWMVRVSAALDEGGIVLPRGPVQVEIAFPGGMKLDNEKPHKTSPITLSPSVKDNTVRIDCAANYLDAFRRPTNDGDRLMIEALLLGFLEMSGINDPALVRRMLDMIASDPHARFFHAFEADTPIDIVLIGAAPKLREVHPLDQQTARVGLARLAGHDGSGPIALDKANVLMRDAVTALWERLKPKLEALDRRSLVARCMDNLAAIEGERSTWRRTAAALLAVHRDREDVVSAASTHEVKRAVAALACRTLIEMGICTSPLSGGKPMSAIDLDDLMGEVSVMLDCASESDALHFDLVSEAPFIHPNGVIEIRSDFFHDVLRPFRDARGARQFATHARSYKSNFKAADTSAQVDERFIAAFQDEFGFAPEELMELTFQLAYRAHGEGATVIALRRAELIKLASGIAGAEGVRAVGALTLAPRARWDENKPANATARDWYPWRFSRRLSLARRPLVQIEENDDPLVLVSPTLLDLSLRYLLRAHDGDLPDKLFERGLRTWVGAAVNAAGHSFNTAVAERLRAFGMEALCETNMTALGGDVMHGDVDVLTWRQGLNIVHVVECKRLMLSRSVGEIGERLREYAGISKPGEQRTPGEKHRDRVVQLKKSPDKLAKLVGVNPSTLTIRSALIFDDLVPMQFSSACRSIFDIVTDFESLRTADLE